MQRKIGNCRLLGAGRIAQGHPFEFDIGAVFVDGIDNGFGVIGRMEGLVLESALLIENFENRFRIRHRLADIPRHTSPRTLR